MPYKNKSDLIFNKKNYYQRNKEKIKKRCRYNGRKRIDRLKLTAQAGYGGECLFCGEDRPEVLVFHHVNEDGKEHRKRIKNAQEFYVWIIDNNFPDDLILLCANCHMYLHRRKIGD
jgi:hypothetical protein